jgi:hypothetical protein
MLVSGLIRQYTVFSAKDIDPNPKELKQGAIDHQNLVISNCLATVLPAATAVCFQTYASQIPYRTSRRNTPSIF